MNYIKKRQEDQRKQIDGLEGFLSGVFAPVAPSQDFVSYLGERLTSYPKNSFEIRTGSYKWYQYTIMALIIILGGGVLLAMAIRFFITWIAWLSLFRQLRHKSQ